MEAVLPFNWVKALILLGIWGFFGCAFEHFKGAWAGSEYIFVDSHFWLELA